MKENMLCLDFWAIYEWDCVPDFLLSMFATGIQESY